jgi:hypothetical protein
MNGKKRRLFRKKRNENKTWVFNLYVSIIISDKRLRLVIDIGKCNKNETKIYVLFICRYSIYDPSCMVKHARDSSFPTLFFHQKGKFREEGNIKSRRHTFYCLQKISLFISQAPNACVCWPLKTIFNILAKSRNFQLKFKILHFNLQSVQIASINCDPHQNKNFI